MIIISGGGGGGGGLSLTKTNDNKILEFYTQEKL